MIIAAKATNLAPASDTWSETRARFFHALQEYQAACLTQAEVESLHDASPDDIMRADDSASAAHTALTTAIRRLVAMPAPDVHALAEKAAIVVQHGCLEHSGASATDPDDLAEFMTENPAIFEGLALVRIYQDLKRLSEGPSPITRAQPFDAAKWVEAVEAIPGNGLTVFGISDGPARPLWEALSGWKQSAVVRHLREREASTAPNLED